MQKSKNQIDKLVYKAVFGSKAEIAKARFEIWQMGIKAGIIPSSINDFYMARGENKINKQFTVPAINIRGMAYDSARAAFGAAKQNKVGALIFEIARSEMSYTDQSPQEYVSVITAAALREKWSGPLFIQGDHFQAKASKPGVPKEGEIDTIKDLIKEAIDAGFYNIDIDMSTLVDLSKPNESDQQKPNIKYSLEFAHFIRGLEPKGVTISLGGEIGHIGGKNSTIKDFRAYMDGFNKGLKKNVIGMSKISVQTGTHHGGVVMADGKLADVDVDFSILSSITKEGKKRYKLGGAVQHGASTLPDKFFNQFAKSDAIEVHLATGFQNILLDHPDFPKKLLTKMYRWLDSSKLDEKEDGQSDEQFHYSLRKKALGKFKQELWDISGARKAKLRAALNKRFTFFFKQLRVSNTQNMVADFVKPTVVKKTKADFKTKEVKLKEVKGLSD